MHYHEPRLHTAAAIFEEGSYSALLSIQPPAFDVAGLPPQSDRYSIAWNEFRRLLAASKRTEKTLAPSALIGDTMAATHQAILRDLAEAAREAASPGWDGYSAKAVTGDAVANAEAFVRSLQSTWPQPKILIDPDGDVWFQWQQGPSRTFAVAIDATGMAHYAGLFGPSRFHGAEMLNEQLRGVVQASLERLFPETAAPRR